ncbi:pantoate--beta-alanine ligase [Paracoccus jiaweipingae]|uniref:pantoate--beta-alanine ligase n=1 Tax=unclassified Paracoccus (in: a-proteobacteria) TaxID=2688777 RepID=UPI0037A15DC9
MDLIRNLNDLRARVAAWKAAGQRVAVVPTMGALHDGHLSLVAAARAACDRVIVTLFVNPRQFDNPDDLSTYPRTEDSDRAALAPHGVDLLFAPDVAQVYPQGFATTVSVAGLSQGLCGDFRPGHFDGMATVVTKLFTMTQADDAFFGEKDWQQLQIVRRLVADLNLPVTVHGCPTLRAADGLAMSSRNQRLSPADRATAPALYAAMRDAARAIGAGQPVAQALDAARAQVVAAGFDRVEYLELRHAHDLTPLDRPTAPARLLAAAWLGPVRLIDNIGLEA